MCLKADDVSLLQLSHAERLATSQAVQAQGLSAPEPPSPLLERINAAPTAAARLELLLPLVWVHTPKTGTGIITTLYSHASICPLAPAEAKTADAVMGLMDEEFYAVYPRAVDCPGSFNLSYSGLGHLGFSPYYEGNEGHAIGMFRNPEQQVLSAYYWMALSGFEFTPDLANLSVKEWAIVQQGCQVKMLADDVIPPLPALSPCVNPGPPTDAQVDLAVKRLQAGFAFVGLTEEWDLSMCLFHAKFGGECTADEFVNTRPGDAKPEDALYDISILEGWRNEKDWPVFRAASKIFYEDLERFGVSHDSCSAWCYPQGRAGVFNASAHKSKTVAKGLS